MNFKKKIYLYNLSRNNFNYVCFQRYDVTISMKYVILDIQINFTIFENEKILKVKSIVHFYRVLQEEYQYIHNTELSCI